MRSFFSRRRSKQFQRVPNLDLDDDCLTSNTARNTRDNDEVYVIRSGRKGTCFVISNEQFKISDYRKGSQVDCQMIKKTFKKIGFDVEIRTDLTAEQIRAAVIELSNSYKTKDKDALFLFILTHGANGDLRGVDEQTISIDEIELLLNNSNAPHLMGKPKVVFMQACRGEKVDRGVPRAYSVDSMEMECDDAQVVSEEDGCILSASPPKYSDRLPIKTDTLLVFATQKDHVAYRNTETGSWFVEAICNEFSKNWKKKDILEMLTSVNSAVAETKGGANKQMPTFTSTLCKKVYLHPRT